MFSPMDGELIYKLYVDCKAAAAQSMHGHGGYAMSVMQSDDTCTPETGSRLVKAKKTGRRVLTAIHPNTLASKQQAKHRLAAEKAKVAAKARVEDQEATLKARSGPFGSSSLS